MGIHVPGTRQPCYATEQFDYRRKKFTYSPTQCCVLLERAENHGKPPLSGKNKLDGSAVRHNTQNWVKWLENQWISSGNNFQDQQHWRFFLRFRI